MCRLRRDFFFCGENDLHLLTPNIGSPFGLGVFQTDVKTIFLNGNFEERSTWINLLVLHQKIKRTKFVILKDPFIVSNNLSDSSISDSMKLLFLLVLPWFQKTIICMARKLPRGLCFSLCILITC